MSFTAFLLPVDRREDTTEVTIVDEVAEISDIVGGSFTVVRFEISEELSDLLGIDRAKNEHECCLYLNDEGLNLGLSGNPRATWLGGQYLVGPALIAGAVSPDGEQLSVPSAFKKVLDKENDRAVSYLDSNSDEEYRNESR